MSFTGWKRRSKQFTDLYGRFGQAHLAAVEAACQSAYKAGERQGRKDVESVAVSAIGLREKIRAGQIRVGQLDDTGLSR